jgi:hypothetical protein
MNDMATPPKIIVDMSNLITTIAEKVLIFYPTPKNSRIIINVLYVITFFAAMCAILSYDYETPTIMFVNATSNITNLTMLELANPNSTIVISDTTQYYNHLPISQPHPLVENKYIRLVVGIIGAYLAIAFVYSNTMHTKLPEWDLQNPS